MHQEKECFCAFAVVILWGKWHSFFSPATANVGSETLPYLVQIECFPLKFWGYWLWRLVHYRKSIAYPIQSNHKMLLFISPQIISCHYFTKRKFKLLLVHRVKENCSWTKKYNKTVEENNQNWKQNTQQK